MTQPKRRVRALAPTYSPDEFEAESRRIDRLTWDALAIDAEQRVLFCGFQEPQWIRRAIAAGAKVTVIEHRDASINANNALGVAVLRGSTSVIPARADAYDVAVAYYYLHEIDPFFHAQVVSELARVARRVAVVEPAPPADPLGRRIAALYSQAKRELGAFEYYQSLDYWRKLLVIVKAEVAQTMLAFTKVPPREYLSDSIKLMLDTMEAEAAPKEFLEELRALADRPDAQLLPQARYILIGAAAGEMPKPASIVSGPVVNGVTMPLSTPDPAIAPAASGTLSETGRYIDQRMDAIVPEVDTATPAAPASPFEQRSTSEPAAAAPPTAPAAVPPPPNAPANVPAPNTPAGFGFGFAPMPPEAETPVFPPNGFESTAAESAAPPFGSPFAVPEPPADEFAIPPMPDLGETAGQAGWRWEPPEIDLDADSEPPAKP